MHVFGFPVGPDSRIGGGDGGVDGHTAHWSGAIYQLVLVRPVSPPRGNKSPWEWNLVIRRALDLCADKWCAAGYGVRLPIVGLT
eukprot:2369893-Pyramimonas_sp.AAC.1